MAAIQSADLQALIQTKIAGFLQKPLTAASAFMSLGCRVFDTATPLSVPTLSTDVAGVTWIGESETIPEATGPGFGAVTLMPSTMKSVKTLRRFSNESLREASLALDSIIQEGLVNAVARVLDAQFFSANGDGIATPKGIFGWTGVQTKTSTVTGSYAVDDLFDVSGMALATNLPQSSLKWLMSPATFSTLRKTKAGTGLNSYLLQTDLTAEGTYRLLGSPVVVHANVPNNKVVLLNPGAIAIARDAAPTVKVDASRYFETDETAIRVASRFDWKPLDPQQVIWADPVS